MAKKLSQFLPHKFTFWLIFTVIITAFCGLVYVAVQQDMRIGTYDPQIQMAEDSAITLGAGQKVNINNYVDVATSLAPFIILYNSQGQVVSSGAKLNGQTPVLPSGVFNVVKNKGEARFTWQPQDDVRIATIVTKYNNGYVLAGRNMREVENRINMLSMQVGVVWVVSMGIVTVLSLFL